MGELVCDRCGAESEPGEGPAYLGWQTGDHVTLCPKCADSLASWWLQPQRRWGRKAG